jgi:hypothetical protein
MSNEQVTFRPNQHTKRSIYTSRLNRRVLASLADFFSEGLREGDLCVAILTPRHRRALNRRLRARGIDVRNVAKVEQYLTVNARSIMPMIDFEGEFDEAAYHQAIQSIADLAAQEDQPVRAFGEVVGLKWPRLGSRLGLYVPQNE